MQRGQTQTVRTLSPKRKFKDVVKEDGEGGVTKGEKDEQSCLCAIGFI